MKKKRTPTKHSAVARDLRTPKYKMRVKADKRKLMAERWRDIANGRDL